MEKDEIRSRLMRLEREIEEIRARLPAHSVKPGLMAELFNLEDERQALRRRLKILKT